MPMDDDGDCHICRRTPLKQSRFYRITTCENCAETAKATPPLSAWQRIVFVAQTVARNVAKIK